MKKFSMRNTIPKHRKVIYFSLFLSMLILTFFSLQSCEEATAPEIVETSDQISSLQKISDIKLKSGDYEELIRETAYGMAKFLDSEHNRKLLYEELTKSKYVENILEASQFLNKSRNIYINNNISEELIVKGIAENIGEKVNFISKITNLNFGMIDIYFPLKEWRKEWNGGDNLLVAAVGYRKNDDESDILAYDLSGNEVYLSATETPQTPTLVIYPSEKRGNYTSNNSGENYYGTLQKSNSVASTNDEGGGGVVITKYRCSSVYIEKDYDSGWFGGDMEIIFKVWKRAIGSSDWGSSSIVEIDPDVNAGVTKIVNKKLYEFHGSNHEMAFAVLEDDGWLNGWWDWITDAEWNEWRRTSGSVLLGTNVMNIPYTITPTFVRDLHPGDDVQIHIYGD